MTYYNIVPVVFSYFFKDLNIKGGVEDTRHKAKAYNTTQIRAKAKDSPSEDRPSQGQGQEYSRPRTKDTGASVFKKKEVLEIFFGRCPKKRSSKTFF